MYKCWQGKGEWGNSIVLFMATSTGPISFKEKVALLSTHYFSAQFPSLPTTFYTQVFLNTLPALKSLSKHFTSLPPAYLVLWFTITLYNCPKYLRILSQIYKIKKITS